MQKKTAENVQNLVSISKMYMLGDVKKCIEFQKFFSDLKKAYLLHFGQCENVKINSFFGLNDLESTFSAVMF